MSVVVEPIEGRLLLRDEWTGVLTRAATATEQTTQRVARAGASLTSAGASLSVAISAPIVAATVASSAAATELNEKLANVSALLTDYAGPELASVIGGMKSQVQDLAVNLGRNTSDIADGLYEVISSLGYGPDTLDQVKTSALAANAGLSTTKDAFGLLSAVTKAYGDTSKESMQRVADMAFTAVNIGQTTFPELAASIGGVAPIAEYAGVSLQEMFAVIATNTGVTGNTSEVVTQMASAITALTAPSDMLKEAFSQVGYESGQAAIQELGFAKTLQEVAKFAEQTKTPLNDLLGRKEAVLLTASLAGAQEKAYVKALEATSKAYDAHGKVLVEAVDKQTNGVNAAGFAWKQFKAEIEVTSQRLGDALLPILMRVGEQLRPIFDSIVRLVQWFAKLPQPIQTTIVVFAGMAAAVGPVTLLVGQLLGGFGMLGGAVGGLTTAWRFLNAPVGQLVPLFAAIHRFGMGIVLLNMKAAFLEWAAGAKTLTVSFTAMGVAIAGVLLLLNQMISKWKEALGAKIAYEVGAANLEGSALQFVKTIRSGATVNATVFQQAQADAASLSKEIDASISRVEKLKKSLPTDHQKAIDEGRAGSLNTPGIRNYREEVQNLERLRGVYNRVNQAISDAMVINEETADSSSGLTEELKQLQEQLGKEYTSPLTNEAKEIADQLAATRQEIELSIRQNDKLKSFFSNIANTEKDLQDLERAHTLQVQYLQDIKDYGKAGADSLKALREEEMKSTASAALARKTWEAWKNALVDFRSKSRDLWTAQVTLSPEGQRGIELERQTTTEQEKKTENIREATRLLHLQVIDIEVYNRILRDNADQWEEQESSIETQRRLIASMSGEMANWAGVFATILEGVDEQVSTVINGFGQFSSALQAYNAEGATWSERAAAGVAMGQGIFQMGQGAGIWQGNRGTGSFGGQLSGDYADIGGMIGGMFGPVWGLVGAAIGSMIKKGADSATAQVALVAGELMSSGQGDRSLRDVARGIGNDIKKSIEAIMAAIGGELTSLPTIMLKIRDDIIRVAVGSVSQSFKTVEEALAFAISEALRQASIAGLSPEMQSALRNTSASTVEEFLADLQTAQTAERFGMSETQIKLDDLTLNFVAFADRLDELGISTAGAAEDYANSVQAIKDQYLGFNYAAADHLKNLFGINKGIDAANEDLRRKAEHQRTILQQQIDNMLTQGPRNLTVPVPGGTPDQTMTVRQTREEWEAAIAELRRQQDAYIEQLENLPERMSDAEINMGIFQTLYRYLEGSRKYAGEAHKYALIQVEAEFAMIRLRLEEAGKFAEFSQMFNDAYQAAREAAGKPRKGTGRGSSNEKDSAKSFAEEREYDLAGRGLSEYKKQLADLQREYAKHIAEAGKDASLRQRLLDLQRQETANLAVDHMKDVDARIADFEGIGSEFQDLRDQAKQLTAEVEESPLVNARKAAKIGRIADALDKQLDTLVSKSTAGILGDLSRDLEKFGLDTTLQFEMRKSMALIEHELNLANYRQRIEILRAEGNLAPEILAMLDAALKNLESIDVTKFVNPASGGTPQFKDWWVGMDGLTNSTNNLASAMDRARDLLKKYQDDQMNPLHRRLSEINTDFADIVKSLGATPEVLTTKAAAVAKAYDDFLQPIRDAQRDAFYSKELSPFSTEERFASIQSEWNAAIAAFNTGDLDIVAKLPDLYKQLLESADEVTPVGSEDYKRIFIAASDFMDRVEAIKPPDLGTRGNPMSIHGMQELTAASVAQANQLAMVIESSDRTSAAMLELAAWLKTTPQLNGGVV